MRSSQWRESNSRALRHADRALRSDFNFRLDDVLLPVAGAGGNVSGKVKFGKRGERDVVRAADAGFEHASAPDGNAVLLAKIVDAAHAIVSADAAKLDIDNLAGAEFDCGAGVLLLVNAFVEANRSLKLALQFHVAENVVPAERLLDHHQMKAFELLQQAANRSSDRRSWRQPSCGCAEIFRAACGPALRPIRA